MAYLNKIQLIGNLGGDAELKNLPDGTAVASWSMAVTRRYTNREGEKTDQTQWFRCKMFGKPAEALAPYLTKGKAVYVEGPLEIRDYEVEQEGVTVQKRAVEVNVREIQLLGGKNDDSAEAAPVAKTKAAAKPVVKAKAAPKATMFDDEDDDEDGGTAPF